MSDQPSIPGPRTDRTRIHSHSERAVPDRVEEFLRAGLVAHVGFIDEDQPRILPFLYLYENGRVYIHGSPGSPGLQLVGDGRPVTLSVAMIDEMVASKTEAGQSANYRSAIVYGHGRLVDVVEEKRPIMRRMAARYFPERETPRDFAPATDRDLERMQLVEITIYEASAKARSGPSLMAHDLDPDFPGTAYVRPVELG
jgi:nitroimidazol reductase NimA-like FMN-containing flavoprotein (pyridoxamine 5'-phosphate oxidase superfamily)